VSVVGWRRRRLVGWLLTVLASSIHTQHQMRITLRAPIAGEETELLFLDSIALSIVGCAHGPCCKIHRVKATWRVASRILPTRKDRLAEAIPDLSPGWPSAVERSRSKIPRICSVARSQRAASGLVSL